ncbi:hypothetical protein QAD02_024407 [Eretmocerus hayati]|uniref:Uncharacterized protein n=1 Tax=Eretmocerus hayati TaxID=131215 RepID=A0ACC2PYR6_9HYME|nr:hypothetical protein QAD02_024407 [Eretmocerus hayati]
MQFSVAFEVGIPRQRRSSMGVAVSITPLDKTVDITRSRWTDCSISARCSFALQTFTRERGATFVAGTQCRLATSLFENFVRDEPRGCQRIARNELLGKMCQLVDELYWLLMASMPIAVLRDKPGQFDTASRNGISYIGTSVYRSTVMQMRKLVCSGSACGVADAREFGNNVFGATR